MNSWIFSLLCFYFSLAHAIRVYVYFFLVEHGMFNLLIVFFFFFVETAMGQHVNAQGNKDSDYVKAVYEYEDFLSLI